MLPKTSAYAKGYDEKTKWKYFLIEDDELVEKYNTILDKISANLEKEFDGEPVYYKRLQKIKIISLDDEGRL